MDYDIIRNNREAKHLSKYLLTVPAIAFDSETDCTTDGFDWMNENQLFWQFSDGKRAFIVDLRRVDAQIFKAPLESRSITKIIQDSSFDCTWTAHEHNIRIRNIHDTRYQEQLILGIALGREMTKAQKAVFEPRYSASLRWSFFRRGWRDKTQFEPMYPLPWEPSQDQIDYMVHDVDQLHDLMNDQIDTLSRMGLENLSVLENEVCVITYTMMLNGFGLNVEGWNAFTAQEEIFCSKILNQLAEYANINWGSWQQYCRYFGVHRTSDLKDLDCKEDFLTLGASPHDALRRWEALCLFRLYQERRKNVTTYGRSFIDQFYRQGLVRSKFTQIVNTGRFSSAQPDLQNIPSTTPHKSFMVPGHGTIERIRVAGNVYINRNTNVFFRADFSGQEMAIIAFISQEPSWLQCLRDGGDLHTLVASTILAGWSSWPEEKRKRERRIIKVINFSIAYGAGVDTIAARAQADPTDISMRLGLMQRAYPKVFASLNYNADLAKKTFEVRSLPPFNRYRSLALEPEGWRRRNIGKNHPVQGTAADMAKLALVYFQYKIDEGLPALLCHMEHDELIGECRREDADACAEVLRECMSRACADILGEALSQPEITISDNWDKRSNS